MGDRLKICPQLDSRVVWNVGRVGFQYLLGSSEIRAILWKGHTEDILASFDVRSSSLDLDKDAWHAADPVHDSPREPCHFGCPKIFTLSSSLTPNLLESDQLHISHLSPSTGTGLPHRHPETFIRRITPRYSSLYPSLSFASSNLGRRAFAPSPIMFTTILAKRNTPLKQECTTVLS